MSPTPDGPAHGPVALVVFDCDGVLVDSERIACQAFARVLDEVCGLRFGLDDMVEHFLGRSGPQCLERLEALLGRPPPAEVERRYRDDIDAALAESVTAVDGVEDVLAGLGRPCCVASSGSHDKMRITLGKTGLERYFGERVFSVSEVARGKPHPDIYLHAAARSGGFDPRRCLVVEDSPTGVRGAVAAGMRVFGFADLIPARRLRAAGAHRVFDSMSDLPALIAEYD